MADKNPLNFEKIVANPKLLTLAARQLVRLTTENPCDTNAIWQLAETYRKQGELQKAAEFYLKFFTLSGQDELARDLFAITSGRTAEFIGQDKCYPVPFVLQNDYLTGEELSALCDYVRVEAWRNYELSKVGKGEYDENLRQSFDLPMPDWLKQKMRKDITGFLPELVGALNINSCNIDRIDLYLRSYGNGHFFGVHTDKTPKIQRQLSMSYFFYIEPQQFTGGDLLIFDTDLSQLENRSFAESFTRLKATQNTLVIFPSAAYHAVSTVHVETDKTAHYRYAVNAHVWENDQDER